MPDVKPDAKTEQNDDKAVRSRRAFLKGAGVAGVAAAMSVALQDEAEAKSAVSKDTSGYQETDHVNAYYAAAKF